jgi:hypothetical protein
MLITTHLVCTPHFDPVQVFAIRRSGAIFIIWFQSEFPFATNCLMGEVRSCNTIHFGLIPVGARPERLL